VATIVDGVTKLGKVQFSTTTEQQVENYRKMLLSMAEELAVPSDHGSGTSCRVE